ncbi:hypothetical protein [Lentzea sp. NPDC051838]|uniref:hypothetical protein n=1 Tax=Lentzea sp. NPDC051838 TaxID=3154849 RepID=UPI00341A2E5A
MSYDPPLSYRVHRVALVVLCTVVALLFGLGVVLAAEPVWHQVLDMAAAARAAWRSS